MFDPKFGKKFRQAAFLRRLANLLTQPVLPSDVRSEYLITQAVAEFLSQRVDGLVYPSTQTDDKGFNIVLFRKSAAVQQRNTPKGTVTDVECEMQTSDGFETDYMVIDNLPEKNDLTKSRKPSTSETAKPFLKLDENTFRIHHVEAVSLRTNSFAVRRHEERQGEEGRF